MLQSTHNFRVGGQSQAKHPGFHHVHKFSNGTLARPVQSGASRRAAPLQEASSCDEAQQQAQHQVLQRRSLFAAVAVAGGALSLPLVAPSIATAGSIPLTEFEDPVDKFKLGIPEGWVSGEGAIPTGPNGTRRTLAWFPPEGAARDLNVSVTITNVSFEFTSLGSFGNAGAFAQNLVNSLDRSYLLREQQRTGKPSKEPIQIAKLVDYDSKRGMYYVEYTVQMLPQEPRHLFSAVALGNNGRYNRLYTCTAQCDETDVAANKAVLEAVVNSFRSEVAAR
uniref:PsbP C-terminal domain-containing protein n=1 Tax=Dunaliella tertiolecta TaxID=3047 RepID=A0A7S3QY67_DUNTE|mmetsp:Transcript_27306/g.73811  ORF Transcript_27306/g.73811 Transcript_27306/m.73811 type:complete len:279 (+) Transcript_27306:38-874(+)|eukprot:CAMPEP_0202348622 /NCGR_PEP_ID=MMETSP1126-20121109/6463_1 /ASSEMBLY_ACC=CAM_ASM_000457 /TAXON_ID=3047 /ORGANISM="Dunaliella tertiolecta, Strain CCMP1320" /LENGTH=278 /DNA_ID=CAMNT_0048940315 /DNA_START=41 /DNA_END=877 /DNA_ORIENTATION=-